MIQLRTSAAHRRQWLHRSYIICLMETTKSSTTTTTMTMKTICVRVCSSGSNASNNNSKFSNVINYKIILQAGCAAPRCSYSFITKCIILYIFGVAFAARHIFFLHLSYSSRRFVSCHFFSRLSFARRSCFSGKCTFRLTHLSFSSTSLVDGNLCV